MEQKSIYFISDLHLGSKALSNDREREIHIVNFLNTIEKSCQELWLLGDIFDFWFEYRYAIPKGHSRFIGKLCQLSDSGIPIHMFLGNHDMWIFDYLNKECNITLHRDKFEQVELMGKSIVLGHGDGFNPKDRGYNFIRSVFHNRFAQSCFRLIHPDLGIKIATCWSKESRTKNRNNLPKAIDHYNEDIYLFAKEYIKTHNVDYFLFGHRHMPYNIELPNGSRCLNIGDWLTHFSYGELNNQGIQLKYFPLHN